MGKVFNVFLMKNNFKDKREKYIFLNMWNGKGFNVFPIKINFRKDILENLNLSGVSLSRTLFTVHLHSSERLKWCSHACQSCLNQDSISEYSAERLVEIVLILITTQWRLFPKIMKKAFKIYVFYYYTFISN